MNSNDCTSQLLRKFVSTHASPRPLLTERLSPLHRREDCNCTPSLPELKRSTDTPHGTQTGLHVKTAPDAETRGLAATRPTNQTSGVSTIRQDSFLSFTSTRERSFTDHRLNWPGRQRSISRETSEILFHHDDAGPEPNLQHTPEEIVISCSARPTRE